MYRHQEKLTPYQLAEAFPDECKNFLTKKLKKVRKELKPYLDFCKKVNNSFLPAETKWFWINVCKKIYMPHEKVREMAEIKATLNMIGKKLDGGVNEDHIFTAKNVSIKYLYDFEKVRYNSRGFTACCPFGHVDKTPSFSVRDNRFTCFSCGEYGDAIDFVQKIRGLSFIQAVKSLIENQ